VQETNDYQKGQLKGEHLTTDIDARIATVKSDLISAKRRNESRIKQLEKKHDRIRKESYIIKAHMEQAKLNVFRHMLGFKNVAQLKASIKDKMEKLDLPKDSYFIVFDAPDSYYGMKVHIVFVSHLTFDIFEEMVNLFFWIPKEHGAHPFINLYQDHPAYEFSVPTNIQCIPHFFYPCKEIYEKIITTLPRDEKEARNTWRISANIYQRHKDLEAVCDKLADDIRNLRNPIFIMEQELSDLIKKKELTTPDEKILKDPKALKTLLQNQARMEPGDGFILKNFDHNSRTAVFEVYGSDKYSADLKTKQDLIKRIGWALKPDSPIEIENHRPNGLYGGFSCLRFTVHLKDE